MGTDSVHPLVQITPAPGSAGRAGGSSNSVAPEMTLEQARSRLEGKRGQQYWRSLEELSQEPGFTELLHREFPRQASEWVDPVSRRGFLKLMGASLALAGLAGCTRQPPEYIVPYVEQPEDLIPGKPMYFATARPASMGAQPLLVESHEFRPTKLEGNPDHPYSGGYPLGRGATDMQSQASILDLYDPDRAQAATFKGEQRTFGDFVSNFREALAGEKGMQGAGVRLLTNTIVSPTLANQIRGILQANPQAKWYQWEGMNRDNARAGSRLAFGQYLEPHYNLRDADVILSLDADFLSGGHFPGFLKLARDFASRRKLIDTTEMSRFYVVESHATATGLKADNRLGMPGWQVAQFAGALGQAVGAGSSGKVELKEAQAFLDAVVKDLQAHRGRSVVIPGEQQSPEVHALAASINNALGNIGKTVNYAEPVEIVPTEQAAGIKELVADMKAGKVNLLLILDANPVYSAPDDLDFAGAMDKVKLRAIASTYTNETSRLCHWHVPLSHYLEYWSDARAFDGTVSIVQPLIEPLYESQGPHEVIATLSDSPGLTGYELVKQYWQGQYKGADFEKWWRRAVHDGFVPNTIFTPRPMSPKGAPALPAPSGNGLELVLRPDPCILDGTYSNNAWLQEAPKPVTKLTWDNAVLMSSNTAQSLGFANEDVVEVELEGRKVKGPVLRVPGHPDNTVTIHLGYGRDNVGRIANGPGFNAYKLRTTKNLLGGNGVQLKNTGEQLYLAITQHHHLINVKGPYTGMSTTGEHAEMRHVIRSAELEEYKRNPGFANEGEKEAPPRDLSLYPNYEFEKLSSNQWGMAIDMNSCVGCNSCIVACVAENNISVVGKDQVIRGRQMYWLRIDTYFMGDQANPRGYFQPIPCMQCENAPCEPVCPVAATVHSPEGLNNMVYNRCVGTRYCSNNCPYKVRRFNFLLFADYETESLKLMRNPDVSVRSRGVMEKCTYCVQRITAARIVAEKQDRIVEDGEVLTACQQACPTDAIIFGNLSDPKSRVNQMKKQQRNYALLSDLNTRPRTTYLAAVNNENPELAKESPTVQHG